MDVIKIAEALHTEIIQAPLNQWLGVFFGILQVWFAKSNKAINYLFGIIGILITVYVLFEAKLYAEIILNLYYLVMSMYGWWYWFANKTASQQPISYVSAREWLIVGLIVGLSFCIFYFGLISVTDSDVPLWDSLVSCTAWAGMWLLAKRKIENWILLNISNALAIPLLYHKGLILYAIFTFFLFLMAIWGYFNWQKILKNERDVA